LLSSLFSPCMWVREFQPLSAHWAAECWVPAYLSLLPVTINYPKHGFQDSKITLRKGIQICQSGHIYVHIIHVLLLLLVSITGTHTATVAFVMKWILFERQDLEELYLPSSYWT
jgi:hypothetical protein